MTPAQTPHDVIILGAGAAGLFAAIAAGQRGRRVLLLDHAEELAPRAGASTPAALMPPGSAAYARALELLALGGITFNLVEAPHRVGGGALAPPRAEEEEEEARAAGGGGGGRDKGALLEAGEVARRR
jgi:2-polyprenyl-6-methoxyphenol hydroxylase-like FAD-dependent oxidoreductase